MARLAAAAALEREEVGVVAVAPQGHVGPPDDVAALGVEDELGFGHLHHAGAQLVPIVVHVDHLTAKKEKRLKREQAT